MWTVESSDTFQSKIRRLQKKHAGILRAVLNNLDTYLRGLNESTRPSQVQAGFIHREKHQGLIAIDQTGAPRKMRETRLYAFPDEANRVLHLITIGFKDTQKQDLAVCAKYISALPEEG